MTEESELLKAVLLQSSQAGDVLFRNQSGKYELPDGRWLTSGLCTGSSDLIGWSPTVVTPEMVGKTVAIFTAIECKSIKGRLTKEQQNFLKRVRAAGGVAKLARPAGHRVHLTEV